MSRLAGFSGISKSRRRSGDAGAARLIDLIRFATRGLAQVNDVVGVQYMY